MEEEIKINKEKEYLQKLIYQNYYKKIKKNIFSFNGLWSNKDIFYSSNDGTENEDTEEENENENSLEIINKDIYKIQDTAYAVVETNGTLNAVKMSENVGQMPLNIISNGETLWTKVLTKTLISIFAFFLMKLKTNKPKVAVKRRARVVASSKK